MNPSSKPASRTGAVFTLIACACLFFLATADQFFAIRIHGVNVRIANALLAAGFAVWCWRRRGDSTRDLAGLAIAWLPFVAVYGLAAAASDTPRIGLLKLSWFAFSFASAFAWCRLFRTEDLTRGYFAAFLAVSAVIVVDFTSGFTRGPGAMIGYGQSNDLIPSQILYRPHAFYYEPSYAASGVGLAWLLALTPLGRTATALSTLFLGVGIAAIAVTMSRAGWLLVTVTILALLLFGKLATGVPPATSWRKGLAAMAVTAIVFGAVLAPERNRIHIKALLHSLGWQQTYERVCPMVRESVTLLDLRCSSDEQRLRSVGRTRDAVPESTSEGQRLTSLKKAIADLRERPLLGGGVKRGEHRLIEPTESNVWLEIAVEGGLLSVAAFLWGLGFTLHRWRIFEPANRALAVVLLLYFALAWQFLQTFPRLDQWLSFWVALTFAERHARMSAAAQRDR